MSHDQKLHDAEIDLTTIFLSSADLVRLTGCTWHKKQCKWLSDNGWTYVVNAKSEIIVSRYHAEKKLKGLALIQTRDQQAHAVLKRLAALVTRLEQNFPQSAKIAVPEKRLRGRPRKI